VSHPVMMIIQEEEKYPLHALLKMPKRHWKRKYTFRNCPNA